MSNITKLEFAALDISGKNYLSWILNAEIHLDSITLGNTIIGGNIASLQDRANALIFIRYHIDECLKNYNQSQNKNNTSNNQKLNRFKKNYLKRQQGHITKSL